MGIEKDICGKMSLTRKTENQTTVGYYLAFRLTTGDGVRFWNESLETPADRVSELVGHAHRAGTAWGRVARIGFFNAPENKDD